MSYTKAKLMGLGAVIAAGIAIAGPAQAQNPMLNDAGLSSEALAQGQTLRAIAALESELRAHPDDPALLINLGIAQAQSGQLADARESFKAAMRSRHVVELETADGRATDSRRLARLAMAMLDRGEFRPDLQFAAN